MKILRTEHLLLRPWEERDADDLYAYARDPSVGPITGWPPHKSIEESRQILRTVLCVPHTFAICLLQDGRPIGSISLKTGDKTDMTDRSDECELGYWMGKPFWGRGLMPEAGRAVLRYAFCDLGMRAVWCGYYEGNDRSRRVQEKLGFRPHHVSYDLDVPLMGETRTGYANLLTREQWEG